MKELFIEYNPYRLATTFTVDGEAPAENHELLSESADKRLQEWVEKLPKILLKEHNQREWKITFRGTTPDFDDLMAAFQNASDLEVAFKHIPVEDTRDRDKLIEELFQEIKRDSCPIPELNADVKLWDAYKKYKSDEFEICVVATVSAGKSTLINAMLGTKLLPSKQEACTAMITRIKDKDSPDFRADVFYKGSDLKGKPDDAYEHIDLKTMKQLNENEKVSTIVLEGDIPFLDTGDLSLVLIDTPGPNNARDEKHREVQESFLDKDSKTLVLYVMTGQFGTTDDDGLLAEIRKSMADAGGGLGNRFIRERFIFVVNKMDERKEDDDGSMEDTLEKVRKYLARHKIEDPTLFPIAALPAMDIRRSQSGQLTNKGEQMELEGKIGKFNCTEELHLEKYATLPRSVQDEIQAALKQAEDSGRGDQKYDPNTALIHTGVVSLEAAIRQYLKKYARSAKVRTLVDIFQRKLDDKKNFVKVLREICEKCQKNKEKQKEIQEEISQMQARIDSGEEAKELKASITETVENVKREAKTAVEKSIAKFQGKITERINRAAGKEIEESRVEAEIKQLREFAKELEPKLKAELDKLVRKQLVETCEELIEDYKKKLAEVPTSISIDIAPLDLVSGEVSRENFTTWRKIVQERQVLVGEEWVPNEDKKWYKPWTWFDKSGWTRSFYRSEKFVDSSQLAQMFFGPLQTEMFQQGEEAKEYVKEQAEGIAQSFQAEFKELKQKLDGMMETMNRYTANKEEAEKEGEELEKKLNAADQEEAEERGSGFEEKLKRLNRIQKWLDDIQAKIDSILEL